MIKVYFGPMGSGKTEILIKEYNKIYLKNKTQVFSPKLDNRFGIGNIRDRKGNKISSEAIDNIFEIPNLLKSTTKHVFIDEANFFESAEDLEKNITQMDLEQRRYDSIRLLLEISLEKNIDFNIFGLNLTAEMKPYGIMPLAIAFADERHELKAECIDCGAEAKYTYYIPGHKTTNVIGADDYCAVCGSCHLKWTKLLNKNPDKYKKLSDQLRIK